MKTQLKLILTLFLYFLVSQVQAKTWTWFFDENKTKSFDVGVDAYYTSAGLGLPIGEQEATVLDVTLEQGVYGYLAKNFYKPSTMRLELSVNPLPLTGAYLKGRQNKIYNQAGVSDELNLVEAATVGFPDPGAVSLFFGNKVYMGDYETGDIKGIGYGGALLNVGNYHILKNNMYEDYWAEGEFKLKGSAIQETKDFSWSFRLGGKLHSHELINNSLFLSIKRDQTDRDYTGWSLTTNAFLEVRFDANLHNFLTDFQMTRYVALYGKKVPFAEGKYVFSFALGVLRQDPTGYKGWLSSQVKDDSGISFLIQPNLAF